MGDVQVANTIFWQEGKGLDLGLEPPRLKRYWEAPVGLGGEFKGDGNFEMRCWTSCFNHWVE